MILIDLHVFSKPPVVCTCQLLAGNGTVLMQAKFYVLQKSEVSFLRTRR